MWNEVTSNMTSSGMKLAEYGHDNMHWSGHGHGPFGILLVVAVVIILAVLATWICRRGKACGHGATKSALDTLAQRYALGEIDKDEYLEKKDVLKSRR